MRTRVHHILERHRVIAGRFATNRGDLHGSFVVPCPNAATGVTEWLRLLVGTGDMWVEEGMPGPPWEHVSVVVCDRERTPTWEEMCYVKGLVWDDEEVVMQLHPKRSEYVDKHRFCLHLWRPVDGSIPTPPKEAV